VAKVSPKSAIRLYAKPGDMKFDTDFGGVVTVSYSDEQTLATFTLQDVKIPIVKK
jgi:hypothetical protein